MQFEIVADPARKRVRAELNDLIEETEIFSKRRDYYTYENGHGFQFVFITGLLFQSQVGVGVAYFSPAIAVCHRTLARQYRELLAASIHPEGVIKERWKPPNFLHLFALRGTKEQMFGDVEPLAEAAKEEMQYFISQLEEFRQITDPATLRKYLNIVGGIYGPAGLLFEMFLDQLALDKSNFAEKYKSQSLAPMHQKFFQAIMAS